MDLRAGVVDGNLQVHMNNRRTFPFATVVLLIIILLPRETTAEDSSGQRERLLMDFGWRFAFGNADPAKDFNPDPNGTWFSYFAKAGTAGGAASPDFDDRGWRTLDVPHDWAVEMPFSDRGGGSHGYKAIGQNFPESSVGWYRKTFTVPASDLGKRITVDFDGVFRDSQVWVNGFYLGRESSGYSGFGYDISDYLNYGGNNVIAVRVDASLEEGWFYEGAGIYRHVWLTKTAPLHVGKWGTRVTTEVKDDLAVVTARALVNNDAPKPVEFTVEQTILDADGQEVSGDEMKDQSLGPGGLSEFAFELKVADPKLWSPETPYLYKLVTIIRDGDTVVDRYETPFGIRTLRWDANEGFFLNGKRVELKGVCNHQDHAGVGVAVPDELDVFRLMQLKKMGCNAIRTSHNAPAPELLDACDRLGILVMDENREVGINPQQLGQLGRLILRDRNHPSVVIWSLGNEEWHIEGNDYGKRITETMQTLAQRLDPTRRNTMAISGGWGQGTSISIDVMGFNYYTHGDGDAYHRKFPDKPSVATEDASTVSTRGIYVEDLDHQHLTAYDTNHPQWAVTAEQSWSHYDPRPWVAGLFQWTGFDYRGEETPFYWPAISSQFGILDTCGFPKDNFYYYQAWWTDRPMVHLFPHWDWPGREGQDIDVWVFSNCEEVELFLNGQSLGRQTMKKDWHVQWKVKYAPGTLVARGYNGGKETTTDQVETTGAAAAIQMTPHKAGIRGDHEDLSVITVQVNDTQGRMVPTADNAITLDITGPGKIIGVGNGDPSSHEPDQYVEKVEAVPITGWRMSPPGSATNLSATSADFDDSGWQEVFVQHEDDEQHDNRLPAGTTVYRGKFESPQVPDDAMVALEWRSLGARETIYINGAPVGEKMLGQNRANAPMNVEIILPANILRPGGNVIAAAVESPKGGRRNQSSPGVVKVTTPAGAWKRSLFSGLAQVIVQSTGLPGEITLTAKSQGLTDGVLEIQAEQAERRPFIP
jgi:beta-galactosidase